VQQINKDEIITIGSPIANTQVYILDSFNNLQPIGSAGELYIAGDGLARGYLYQPQLTVEKFVPNPFNPGTLMYKTGDLARWQHNNTIEYLGRIDTQVKIRGFRIEIGEIESNLGKYPKIKECAVVAQGQKPTKACCLLCCQSLPAKEKLVKLPNEELKNHLQQFLPEYMLPATYISLKAIPLTQNGKINRLVLQNMETSAEKSKDYLAPGDDIENRLVDMWAKVLELKPESIGVNDNFFDVGGNSISAVALAATIEKTTLCKFSPVTLFKHSTIKGIAQYIQQHSINHQKKPMPMGMAPFPGRPKNLINPTPVAGIPDYYEDSMAIIGISCNFPEANDHWKFWQNLIEGRESINLLSKEEAQRLNVPPEILNSPGYVPLKPWMDGKEFFDPEFFQISSGNAALMDPQFRQLLLHSWKAVEDAGYSCDEIEKTSVSISASNNFYQAMAAKISSEPHVMENSEEFVSWILAQGGTIPTMISYQLGLKGPSAFVHSNCSSSMTGLYYAFQSLQSKDVDYALVGAATLSASLSLGYLQMPGMNFSNDGHCKTFDAKADGMVDGEGVGVILVKRAKDAIKDGDHIYCLVRGISINNDGAEKVGFYAPSVPGQTSVICHALEKTKIDPESIGYVEAHGTGTALGDPIEVLAISEAYEKYTNKKQFCAIGSVKPNIGHLDTAAGLAGCIKLAVSLYHKKFPPIINFTSPNPQIDFKNSPFYVLDKEESWSNEQYPKRAALSSFGIGGTNAHAILEEYAPPIIVVEGFGHDMQYAIPLSAQKEEVLLEYAQNLLTFLRDNEDGMHRPIKLSEMAFTLQTGRKVMKHRVVFVVNTLSDLALGLGSFIENKKTDAYFHGNASTGKKPVEALEEDEDYKELIKHWFAKRRLEGLPSYGQMEPNWIGNCFIPNHIRCA
ncbi:MAG: AMP-binding protein, partial [Bacteroidales bacterium]|nr:AMP-binding protein [Bacteroidales bacterium]